MIGNVNITLSKTRDGMGEYLQILTDDLHVNVVLIAEHFEIVDARTGVVAQVPVISRPPGNRRQAAVNADAEDRSVRGRTRKR